ncbi:MAG: hypothetical protein OXG77_00130 [Chloroflexi bacterium]|nr:hypothetical protein [Chloroflexota bacterium]
MLFLLHKAGSPIATIAGSYPDSAVSVIESEKKLQAMHFWMRNPDYLAYEILEGTGRKALGPDWLNQVESLLDDDEPALRRYPMLRYLFGAYEPIDDSFSILAAAGLAVCVRVGAPGNVRQSKFFLLELGREQAERITVEYPELRWYPDRAGLVAQICAGRTGNELKDCQYKLSEYAQTGLGDQIQPITELVQERLTHARSGI